MQHADRGVAPFSACGGVYCGDKAVLDEDLNDLSSMSEMGT
jgi:hypothetical protein